ncbi:MAG: tetratricopeptide repeat protein [Candidatus Binatia bacterium]
MSEYIVDVGDKDFEAAVIERSKHTPVVVDCWAPWCAPCRALGPLLERLAEEHPGAFVLAKVNVDDNPQLSAALGVSSIPMVLGFRDGEPVAEFVGALPEAAVRTFLAQVLPTEADRLAAEGNHLLTAGKSVEAEAKFQQALDVDARCARALFGLAAVLTDRGEYEEALALLDRIGFGHLRQDADRLAAEIRVRQGGRSDERALQAKVVADPADIEARFLLAQALAAASKHSEALGQYLEVVRRNRQFRDDAARKAMLDIFELLGPEHETTVLYRSELAKVLFR